LSFKKETCTECKGTGSVLRHHYSSAELHKSVNHGSQQSSCPRCLGRGYRDVIDNSNDNIGSCNDEHKNRELELVSSWWSMLSVLAFVGAVMYGLGLLQDSNSPIAVIITTEYIGPNGYMSEMFAYTSITILSLVVGVLARRIIRWVALFAIIGLVAWLIYLIVQ